MRRKVSYSVEDDIVKRFNEVCENNAVNKSALIAKFIDDYTKKWEVYNEKNNK